MKYVWILFGCDGKNTFTEAVFDDKVKAEAAMRELKAIDERNGDTGWLYHIQEKEITR